MVKDGMPTSLISGGYASIRNSILPRAAAILTIRARYGISAMGEMNA